MRKKVCLSLLLSLSSGLIAQAAEIHCTHFWKSNEAGSVSWIPSGKEVGVDVGPSPYGLEGVYRCETDIIGDEQRTEKFLFIGEVGDSAYVILDRYPDRAPQYNQVFTHGLDPNSTSRPMYLRFLPFIISTESLFRQPGHYEFSVHYTDIVPVQTGIRSGEPSFETTSGLAKRAIQTSFGTVYFLVQSIAALLIVAFFLGWPGIPKARRFILAAAAFSSVCVFFSFTGVPRLLVDPFLAIRLNDSFIIAAAFLVNSCSFLFCVANKNNPWVRSVLGLFVFAILDMGVLSVTPLESKYYLPLYSVGLLVLTSLFPLWIGVSIFSGRLRLSHTPLPSVQFHGWAQVIKGLAFGWDIFNLSLLDARFPFVTHYFYLLFSLLILIRVQLVETLSEVRLRKQLDRMRGEVLQSLVNSDLERENALSKMTKFLGSLIGANRISMTEVIESNRIRFVGAYGSYEDIFGLHTVEENSALDLAIRGKKIQSGSCNSDEESKDYRNLTEFYVLPLLNSGRVVGLISVTEFSYGVLSAFLRKRMDVISDECSVLFSLFVSERNSRASAKLIQMNRLRVHHLQIHSERFFLENFDVAEDISRPAFILGDLVDSVVLNDRYGAEVVKKIIDDQLELIFKGTQQNGIILNREKGDAISIIVPNQRRDLSEESSVLRGYAVLQWIMSNAEKLRSIARSNGVLLPFEFRFVMNLGRARLIGADEAKAITGFNLLSDSGIDGAARVLSSVALPGEVIIMEDARAYLSVVDGLIEIPPVRLKGKFSNIRLYLLMPERKLRSA